MTAIHSLLELSAFKAIYRAFGVVLALFFLGACWFAYRPVFLVDASEVAEYANGFALGVTALFCFVIAQHHPLRSLPRLFWWGVSLGLGIAAANESFDLLERVDRAWSEEDYSDLIILGLTPIGLYVARIIESAPRLAIRAMKLGFVFQCVSDLIDLGDGDLYTVTIFDHNLMQVLTGISELIFIEMYLFGLCCLLLSIVGRRLVAQLGNISTARPDAHGLKPAGAGKVRKA